MRYIKCAKCKNHVPNVRTAICYDCDGVCNYEGKQLTNADYIRAMSDEELAAFLYDEGDVICKAQRFCSKHGCKDCILDWLKQPVKDGENK